MRGDTLCLCTQSGAADADASLDGAEANAAPPAKPRVAVGRGEHEPSATSVTAAPAAAAPTAAALATPAALAPPPPAPLAVDHPRAAAGAVDEATLARAFAIANGSREQPDALRPLLAGGAASAVRHARAWGGGRPVFAAARRGVPTSIGDARRHV